MADGTAILGLSAFYHDSAAALVVDGEIVAAAQEERFTRRKHDASFPKRAAEFCLSEAGLTADELDFVAFHEKPLRKFDRWIETATAFAPSGLRAFLHEAPRWLRETLHVPREVHRGLGLRDRRRIVFAEHHESHAASAFFPSPFDESAILTIDGVGEWATATIGVGVGNRIQLSHELRFPHSLGLLYSAFTSFCGFRVNSGEHKLMGLAPYGEPRFVDVILRELIDLKPDGSFRIDPTYFGFGRGTRMTSRRFERLFDGPPRRPETEITQREKDLAASIQRVAEEIVLRMARFTHRETGRPRLCLAGGVALNCVANGRLLREGPFEDIWIQPAAGDAGGALGAALHVWNQLLGMPRDAQLPSLQGGSFLGPAFDDRAIGSVLDEIGAVSRLIEDDGELCDHVANLLAEGNVVGWFHGRMEYGPRALGARCILGDARSATMQSTINRAIKFRESFRPFAPAVLSDRATEFFDWPADADSPYMLFVTDVASGGRDSNGESSIPAVTHVDGTARLQTVDAERHGRFHRLLVAFERRTGTPLVVNTSFNVRGEPIVCTPADAYRCFMATNMDVLVLGNHLLLKPDQPHAVEHAADAHLPRFPLD